MNPPAPTSDRHVAPLVPPPRASWRRPFARRPWLPPAIVLTVMVLSALLAPLFAVQNPYDLKTVRLENGYIPPFRLPDVDADHRAIPSSPRADLFILGSDRNGRDMLSAVLFGLRVSLLVGVCGTALAMGAGVALGLLSGYFGGRLDSAIMRVADIQLSFPSILVAMFMMAVWGPGLWKIVLAVGIVHWVTYARVVRGAALAEREKDYIAAIRALGAGAPRVMARHLLPNLTGPILVVSAVQFASTVILEATLSYLGLGAPETRPSLGMLVKSGYEDFFGGTWWAWFFPGLALATLVLAINWLADVLREQFAVKD